MSLNLYRRYAMQSPWNSKARKQWLAMAATAEIQEAQAAGHAFTPIGHKAAILEAQAIGRNWYAVRHY